MIAVQRQTRRRVEFFIEKGLFLAAAASVLVTAGIIAVLLFETVAFLREVPVGEFLFEFRDVLEQALARELEEGEAELRVLEVQLLEARIGQDAHLGFLKRDE